MEDDKDEKNKKPDPPKAGKTSKSKSKRVDNETGKESPTSSSGRGKRSHKDKKHSDFCYNLVLSPRTSTSTGGGIVKKRTKKRPATPARKLVVPPYAKINLRFDLLSVQMKKIMVEAAQNRRINSNKSMKFMVDTTRTWKEVLEEIFGVGLIYGTHFVSHYTRKRSGNVGGTRKSHAIVTKIADIFKDFINVPDLERGISINLTDKVKEPLPCGVVKREPDLLEGLMQYPNPNDNEEEAEEVMILPHNHGALNIGIDPLSDAAHGIDTVRNNGMMMGNNNNGMDFATMMRTRQSPFSGSLYSMDHGQNSSFIGHDRRSPILNTPFRFRTPPSATVTSHQQHQQVYGMGMGQGQRHTFPTPPRTSRASPTDANFNGGGNGNHDDDVDGFIHGLRNLRDPNMAVRFMRQEVIGMMALHRDSQVSGILQEVCPRVLRYLGFVFGLGNNTNQQ